ncbi:hypothetical protein DPMN_095085 [Dreissena polymorpha]|uniref:Uncharacterized protein n=1 Tax=Dreissena polymorpha TaxID=45954 RepID=A0A9D4L791_DREPO|nr:hypothetical protein DPMN_095085 [Dreissena polymorpha]
MDAGYVIRRRRERRFSRRILVNDIPDDVFVSRYRLRKAGVRRVIELVRQDLQAQTIRGRAISVETKVRKYTQAQRIFLSQY